jgi:hypothetical protein
MRSSITVAGLSLLLFAPFVSSQSPRCATCSDGPEMRRLPVRVEGNRVAIGPSQIASRLREAGGELRDVVHDCGRSMPSTHDGVVFLARACKWGGRYPALLIESTEPDDNPSYAVLALDGNTLEVLFDGPSPDAFVRTFAGFLKADFDEMFRSLSDPSDG